MWHRVICFGTQAETAAKHLSKGDKVMVEGRLQLDQWEDKDGNKRESIDIVANRVLFVTLRREATAAA